MNIAIESTNFIEIDKVPIPEIFNRRFKTDNEVVDKLFGGAGFLPGSTFTLAGGPGSGKSTFLMQVLNMLASQGKNVAYISGEENIYQISFNAKRLNIKGVKASNLTDLDTICKKIVQHKFDIVIVDSFPTITVNRKNLTSKKKEELIVNTLCSLAKKHEITLGFILHVTKQGKYKGSTLLPHTTDMNIMLERSEDLDGAQEINYRDFVVTKNRFGFCSFTSLRLGPTGFVFESTKPSESNKPQLTMAEGIKKFGSYYKAKKFFDENGYQQTKKGKQKVFIKK